MDKHNNPIIINTMNLNYFQEILWASYSVSKKKKYSQNKHDSISNLR